MIRRPPRSTLDRSSAASDVYKRQGLDVDCLLSGPRGGDLQIGARLSTGLVDMVIFLRDPMTPQPVSYTHLRAHETVLDLVCRLLLEKKK